MTLTYGSVCSGIDMDWRSDSDWMRLAKWGVRYRSRMLDWEAAGRAEYITAWMR